MAQKGQLAGEAAERVLRGRRTSTPEPGPGCRGPDGARGGGAAAGGPGVDYPGLAQRLSITPKTADHHIQPFYSKLGVSTRGAAALFAVEHGVLPAETYSA
jgi:hypothetical protein